MKYGSAVYAAAAVACIAAGGAYAQKAKDTLRASVYQPIDVIDDILSPHPETALLTRPVSETLLYYESDARRIDPLLASSWKWIDDRTRELALRRDEDRRSYALFLTQRGQELFGGLLPTSNSRYHEFVDVLSRDERRQLRDLLSKLVLRARELDT